MKPILSAFLIFCISISSLAQNDSLLLPIPDYKPVDSDLYEEIISMDKIFFDAYNNCDLETQAKIYADDIEFFHDQGGLMTSKELIIEGTKNNICGKVSRTVLPESIEVYPIKNYGAVEIGYHRFFNKEEPDQPSKPSKFIAIWNLMDGNWRLAKVISLH